MASRLKLEELYTNMVKARKYVVKSHFHGLPKREDYEIVEQDLPELKNGELMVKTEWISVDPYLRANNQMHPVPFDQFSMQIGQVIDSKDPRFPAGVKVVSHVGWCDYGIVKITDDPMSRAFPLPDLKSLPTSYGLGAVGLPGATAYFGLLELCNPKEGETVVITGAAGAVGSLVGQIAKIKGCKVIGFAGSNKKVEQLETELCFDKAFNYKTVDISKALREAAPDGVDCYFDNVGGEISSKIIQQMNTFGRVACCGSISAYNDDPEKMPKATIVQPYCVRKQIRLEGFMISRWKNRWPEAFSQMLKWIESGQIKAKEHVTEGFDNIFDAFLGMLTGENFGKAVVKI